MVKYLINRPVAVIMTFFALLLLGLYATIKLPISLLPNINIPEIAIRVIYPGHQSVDMEQNVVAPIRMQLQQVPGLKDIESESRDGDATIKLRFDYGEDIDLLYIEVNEKLDMALADLPRDLPRPRVIKASISDLPIFYVNITYADTANLTPERMLNLSQLVSNVIRKRVEQLPEVAIADITGLTTPEITITPDKAKTKALGLDARDIELALMENMFKLGNFRLREGQLVYDVIIDQNVNQPKDIENIPIQKNGRVFFLKEIAQIELKPAHSQGNYFYNGKPAICMPVIKHSSSRMSELKQSITKLIGQMQKEYPELAFSLSHDQTSILNLSIGNLRNSLILGTILAISVMFLFIGDYRSPILMGITIPISLVISMMFFYLTGLSINIVSLSGLIFGVGLMIDNSIIVIDNISQWRTRGAGLTDAVVQGTNEIISPLLSSMLTTIAVFVPLVFLSGISGAMFYDQALAITIGLLVSFWVSITLLPTLYFRFSIGGAQNWKPKAAVISLEKIYNNGFHFVFGRRYLFLLISLFIIALLPLTFIGIEKRQMPELTRNETIVNISWGNNISLEENSKRCHRLLMALANPVDESAFFVGQQQLILSRGMDMSESDASLYFKVKKGIGVDDINSTISNWMARSYPDAVYGFSAPESAFDRIFPAPDAKITVKVAASEGQPVPSVNIVDSVIQHLNRNYGNLQVETVPMKTQINLEMNTEKLALYGVKPESVRQSLAVAFQSNRIGELSLENQVIPIVFGNPPSELADILSRITAQNEQGVEIPIRELVTIHQPLTFRSIYGDINSGAYIPIKINTDNQTAREIHQDMITLGGQNTNYSFTFSGDYFRSKELVMELIGVLLVSVLLLYFILAAQFESLLQPVILLLELPINFACTIGLLWILGGSLNLMSLIGLVVIGGIVVNDSILKIDTTNRLRKMGLSIDDAIHEAGVRRVKPMVMTSITTILALVPILWGTDLGSELQQPLALVTIVGMTFGVLISLYLIPLAYWWIYKNS